MPLKAQKDLLLATKDDIESLTRTINARARAEWTKDNYPLTVKRLRRGLKNLPMMLLQASYTRILGILFLRPLASGIATTAPDRTWIILLGTSTRAAGTPKPIMYASDRK